MSCQIQTVLELICPRVACILYLYVHHWVAVTLFSMHQHCRDMSVLQLFHQLFA